MLAFSGAGLHTPPHVFISHLSPYNRANQSPAPKQTPKQTHTASTTSSNAALHAGNTAFPTPTPSPFPLLLTFSPSVA